MNNNDQLTSFTKSIFNTRISKALIAASKYGFIKNPEKFNGIYEELGLKMSRNNKDFELYDNTTGEKLLYFKDFKTFQFYIDDLLISELILSEKKVDLTDGERLLNFLDKWINNENIINENFREALKFTREKLQLFLDSKVKEYNYNKEKGYSDFVCRKFLSLLSDYSKIFMNDSNTKFSKRSLNLTINFLRTELNNK